MTTDPRLVQLRSLDAKATPGPWRKNGADVYHPGAALPFRVGVASWVDDGALIAAMRNAWPAVLEVVAIALAVHVPNEDYQQHICRGCPRLGRWPCGQYLAALAVLDTLGDTP
jgi:hypothetical protein